MSDPSLELQAALVAAIRAEPDLVAYFAPAPVSVWDTGPPKLDPGDGEEGYPFIRVGEGDVGSGERILYTGEGGVVVDDPSDVTTNVHIFARGPDRNVICKTLAKGVRLAIGRELELEGGFKNTLGLASSTRHFTESDGLTAHSVVTARHYVESSEV